MKKEDLLLERLIAYNAGNHYPFHMPGHKRKGSFPDPYMIDITEIDGFDNLHHADGILKQSMEWAASVYHADRTFYLINGSSCGILASICATTRPGGRILLCRNAHKSAYYGVILNQLKTEYCYPQYISEMGIQGGILPADVEKILDEHTDTEAVFIVSPTYDGVVSDIRAIAKVVHQRNIPLIVDEAHGAHFPFYSSFPQPALACGADIAVQSLHKTLSSFTQTSVLHVREGYVDIKKLERYLAMFQSSSPSYVLMAGIESCIFDMVESGQERIAAFYDRLQKIRQQLAKMKYLKLLDHEWKARQGIFDLDESKIVISTAGCCNRTGELLSGELLGNMLRDDYQLEMEMCSAYTVTAITTWQDTAADLQRLTDALLAIDSRLAPAQGLSGVEQEWAVKQRVSLFSMAEASQMAARRCLLDECEDLVSAEFIYLYPPGIPIIAPGEQVTSDVIRQVNYYKMLGLPVQGMEDKECRYLRVITK